MLRSKKDVDRHVRDLLNKIKSEDERKVRGYNIARLYFNIGEYENARRYLSEFLGVRPKAMDAHRLLGQIYEGLGNKEKAVQSYKTSYELGEGQKDLVLKICELYTDVQADSSVRLYWAEEGHRLYPHHESVVKLREALLTGSGSHSRQELEKLYLDEIKACPTAVRLQTNLLQLYKDWGAEDKNKLNEAYNYSCQVEARKAFSDSLEWYQTLFDIMQAYQNTTDVSSDVEFHTNFLSALERLVYLTLASSSGTALLSQCTITDAATLLHRFDQSLYTSLGVVGQNTQFGQLMVGQLYLHMAIFLIHSAKKDGLTHTSTSAGALLFHACRFRTSESSLSSKSWTSRDQFWHKLACHRLSQAAHVLHHMAKTETEKVTFINKVKQQCSNKETQENIHQTIFGTSCTSKKDKSFFLKDDDFINASLCYPELEQIKEWDSVVGSMYCASLGDMVWLCLQQASTSTKEPQPYYTFTLFEGLQFSTSNVNTGAPETLCHLDLLAFLAATVYCQIAASKEAHGPPPASLPTVVASALNTREQADWWTAAYTLFTNRAHHRLSKLRMTLQRGLEVIRALGNHGVDLTLMAHLAQSFTKWAGAAAEDGSTNSEIDALKDRAEHYWHRVLTLCQRAARNVTNIMPRNPLFVVQSASLSPEEREKLEEEGKYFLAMRLVHSGKQQEAIQALGELKSPEASFQRAMLYKERANAMLTEGNLESLTSEIRSQHTILLTQARDTLYLTLDRLRMPGVDRFHPLNTKLSQQLEDVERRLSHMTLDQDITAQREDDTESISDASQSPNPDLTNGHVTNMPQMTVFSTPYRDIKNSTRITRQEARPSPERLDAQVRALSEVQENTLKNMEEQNAALKVQNEALRNFCTTMASEFKENSSLYRSMLDQNKLFCQEAYTSILNEMKQIYSTVKDLQAQVHTIASDIGDLRALKSVAKHSEVAEIKTNEEHVPVDIPAAVVPQGLYGSYVGYYGQQPVPSPLMPTPGLFGNPPFFPPSTMPEQSFSMAASVTQGPSISTLSQASTSLVTPTLGSPAGIAVKEPISSPSISATQCIPASSLGSISWSLATSIASVTTAGTSSSRLPEAAAPAHAFQITMPPVSNALTPPPRSMPGELLSHTLPCSTTAGLLANVPPPLYSAVTPDSSPVRGESQIQSLSSVMSTEGLSSASNNLIAPSAASGSWDSSLTFMGAFKSPVGLTESKITPVKSKEAADDDNDRYVEDDHDPCPDFKPVVPLPEKVEVRTGEEDEKVLFEERAKLFRFMEKEWRERGTGVMKLLHNPSQRSVRVLMRRDQTHKICANHLVTANIDLQPMKNNDKVWIWAAQDFADEEIRMEKFCCRFKTVEIANCFKEAFLKAKAIAKENEDNQVQQDVNGIPNEPSDQTAAAVVSTVASSKPTSLAEMFNLPPGSWTCQTCLVSNTHEKIVCPACETPHPNAPKTEEPTSESKTPFASFKFSPSSKNEGGTPLPGSFKFVGAPPLSLTVKSTPTTAATTTFGFKFGLNITSTTCTTPSASVVASATPTTVVSIVPASTATSLPTLTTSDTSKEGGKQTFHGFTFTTTPSFKPEKAEEDQPKPQEDEDTKKDEEKKKSIFAGFSFGSSAVNSASTGFAFSTSKVDTKKEEDKTNVTSNTGSLFGNTASGTMLSFASLANTTSSPSSLFTTKTTDAMVPKAVFGSSPTGIKLPSKDYSEDKVEEYEPQVDFQPVIPMPDLVEIKTGEEEEEKLFCERAKLFRYEKESKEWKERGVGELKILKNNSSGKVRILMRREQILKVCANHFLTPEMKLAPMATSDKAWIWAAHDFADQEMKEERFAARFKTQESALAFKEAFEKAQQSLSISSISEPVPSAPTSTSQETVASTTTSLVAMFKPAAGSWECQTCLVRNNATENMCVSCSTCKPGYEAPKENVTKFNFTIMTEENQKNLADSQEKISDTKQSLAGMFKPPAGSWECNSCLVRNKETSTKCIACGTNGPTALIENKPAFSFGIKKSDGVAPTAVSASGGFGFGITESKPAFSFGIPQNTSLTSTAASQSAFTFGAPNKSTQEITATSQSKPAFSFGTSSNQSNKPFSFTWQPITTAASVDLSTSSSSTTSSTFSSTFSSSLPVAIPKESLEKPSTPTKDEKSGFVFGSPGKYEFSFAGIKAKSPRSRDISLCESEDGVVEEDDGDHLYFEAIVPLPEKVEVVTGEEEEDILYAHRAKLFRLVCGEWKERGLGDIKILSHKQACKIRLLMRREQVHKICLNHCLTKDMEFRKKDDKTFYWAALDYSESCPQNETFAIRFKTPEIASDFINAIDGAKVKLGGTPSTQQTAITSTPVKQDQESSGEENLPEALEIPKALASSTDSQPSSTSIVAPADSTTPVTTHAKPAGALFGNAMPGQSIFGGSPGSMFGVSGTPTSTILGETTTSTSSIFGGRITSSSPSIFGGALSSSVFGGTSIFGGSGSNTAPTFITNVSPNFSLKTPAQQSVHSVTTVSHGAGGSSLFGGATSTSVSTRSSFSFGDKFSECESTDSVEIIYEKKATPEQVERARNLLLPDNFYLYEDAPRCPGCRGCENDEEEIDKENQENAPVPTSVSSSLALKPSLFGNSSSVSSSTALFGKSPSTAQSLFGSNTANSSPTILGKPSTSISNLFTNSSPSIFSNVSTPGSSTSIFGTGTTTVTAKSIFGNPPGTTSIFSSTTTSSGSLFGGTPNSMGLFGAKPAEPTGLFNTSSPAAATTVTSVESTNTSTITDSISKVGLFSSQSDASQLSFGDLAEKATGTTFGKHNPAADAIWAMRNQPVFSQSPKKAEDGEEAAAEDNDAHDPHFEPVVPMPDLVEVKTGEEDLEVIFSNRGKLYRYDTSSKQWKERGIGDFKILFDPVNNKYRLLQRRELVHKTCCNHYLTPQLELRPLQTSETAWCWYATDYSDSLEGSSEHLAVRFKTTELAKEFKSKFEECQEKLRNAEASNSTTVSASATVAIPQATQFAATDGHAAADGHDNENDDEDEDYEDEEDEEEEEEDGEDTVIFFNKRCTLFKKEEENWKTLGMGDLRIKYDDDIYGACISMTSDKGETLAEHVIAMQTTMDKEGNAAVWTVLNLKPEPAVTTTFKAVFSSSQALEDFATAFCEGKECAVNAGIMEQQGGMCVEVAPDELYYGLGADEHE
ncbi:E3 SUMO-protein ligase RanBP2 isoform X4 [Cherax quadricarinatus]